MKHFWLLLLVIPMVAMTACDDDDKPTIDVVGLSAKQLVFTGFKDTLSVTTQGNNWWVHSVMLDGEEHFMEYSGTDMDSRRVWSHACEWLTLERQNTTLTLNVTDNPLESNRSFAVVMKTQHLTDTLHGLQTTMWDGPNPNYDYFKLSTKAVAFSAEGGTVDIDSQEKGWWIYQVVVDGKQHALSVEECEAMIYRSRPLSKTYGYLTVHFDNGTLTLTVTPNETGEERGFELRLQSGDAFTTITGTQAS